MRISAVHEGVTKTAESARAFEPPAHVPETATTNVLVLLFLLMLYIYTPEYILYISLMK